MAPASIAIPRLQIRNRQSDLDMAIQGDLLLKLPESAPSMIVDFQDLYQAIVDQQLWINRVGSCWFRCSIYVGGQLINGDHLEPLCGVIQQNEVWEKLGVRLEASEQTISQISFSIQHPNLASSLSPPNQSYTAELLEISVSLSISSCAKKTKSTANKHAVAKPSKSSESITTVLKQEPVEEIDTLDFGDLAAIEAFLFASGWYKDGQVEHTQESNSRSADAPEGPLSSKDLNSCLSTALDAVLYGNKKKHYGVKWIEGSNWPGLIHLAPGVFHMHYLEIVSSKARFLPTLATSLSRMSKAESPGLRQLVDSFTDSSARGKHPASLAQHLDDSESIICGIESKAWITLLANTEIPKLRMPITAKRAAGETSNTRGNQKKARTSEDLQLAGSDTLEICLPDSRSKTALDTDGADLSSTLKLFNERTQLTEDRGSTTLPSEAILTWTEAAQYRQESVQASAGMLQPEALRILGDQSRFEPLDGSTLKFHNSNPAEYTTVLDDFGDGIVWDSSWDALLDRHFDA